MVLCAFDPTEGGMTNFVRLVTEDGALETWMNTTDHVRLTIDLEQVAKNLRTPDGSSVGQGTAKCYLRQVGFSPDAGGTWIGPRAALGRLNHSEVVRIEALMQ